VGTMHYGSVLCVSATMGYKHRYVDHDTVLKGMKAPNFILKIIPHVDGSPRICELVRFHLEDITLKEAWTGPAALGLFPHALADVARLPVREVLSALHFKADLTLGLGSVAFDYMAK
jgi:acetoacetate decarboxylase